MTGVGSTSPRRNSMTCAARPLWSQHSVSTTRLWRSPAALCRKSISGIYLTEDADALFGVRALLGRISSPLIPRTAATLSLFSTIAFGSATSPAVLTSSARHLRSITHLLPSTQAAAVCVWHGRVFSGTRGLGSFASSSFNAVLVLENTKL